MGVLPGDKKVVSELWKTTGEKKIEGELVGYVTRCNINIVDPCQRESGKALFGHFEGIEKLLSGWW